MRLISAVHNKFKFSKISFFSFSRVQNSGIESLVEELCSKLKDIQNKQKGLAHTLYRHI